MTNTERDKIEQARNALSLAVKKMIAHGATVPQGTFHELGFAIGRLETVLDDNKKAAK